MTEYRIRLRGGWECDSIEPPESSPRRLTLPTRWLTDRSRRLRLTRRFNQPRLEAGSQAVLRLERVPGIAGLELNGRPALLVSPERSEYEILLDASAARHCLVLVVQTPDPMDSLGLATEWGDVSVIIRAQERTDSRDPTI